MLAELLRDSPIDWKKEVRYSYINEFGDVWVATYDKEKARFSCSDWDWETKEILIKDGLEGSSLVECLGVVSEGEMAWAVSVLIGAKASRKMTKMLRPQSGKNSESPRTRFFK